MRRAVCRCLRGAVRSASRIRSMNACTAVQRRLRARPIRPHRRHRIGQRLPHHPPMHAQLPGHAFNRPDPDSDTPAESLRITPLWLSCPTNPPRSRGDRHGSVSVAGGPNFGIKGGQITVAKSGKARLEKAERVRVGRLGFEKLPSGHVYDLAIVGRDLQDSWRRAVPPKARVAFNTFVPVGRGGGSRLENYLGFPTGLSGQELASRATAQALIFGVRLVSPRPIDRITRTKRTCVSWPWIGRRPAMLQSRSGDWSTSSSFFRSDVKIPWTVAMSLTDNPAESLSIHGACKRMTASNVCRPLSVSTTS